MYTLCSNYNHDHLRNLKHNHNEDDDHNNTGNDGTDNGAAIWTNAHTCQFVELGWKYLAEGHGAAQAARRRCGCGVGRQRPPKRSLTFV